MKTLVLMPCGGEKLDRPADLFELYTGPMWQTLRMHLGSIDHYDVVVLSAKWGFTTACGVVDPYDRRLGPAQADYLIAGGIFRPNDHFGEIQPMKGALGPNPFVTVRRSEPFAAVINAGAGHYKRVFDAFIPLFQKHGAIARDALILTVAGGIGEQRSQLGSHLRRCQDEAPTGGAACGGPGPMPADRPGPAAA